ncbi:MAG: hypothetical protein ACE366_18685 [Bradymonadia bacterium]
MSVRTGRWMAAVCALAVWASAGAAWGFQILTPASEPCHERLMLGALDLASAPFSAEDDTSLAPLLDTMVAEVERHGFPNDKATRGFVRDVAELYGFEHLTGARRYVVASFIIGVRAPDTDGFAVVQLNEVRTTHIDDDKQGVHSLRRSFDDGPEGNLEAIVNTQEELKTRFEEMSALWRADDPFIKARWTFPFYGEAEVWVYGPAMRLGEMAHTTQDAFTHTLRDADLQIVTVLNFVDPVLARDKEGRDGLPHSDRLDECDVPGDDFDVVRVTAARLATVDLLNEAFLALEAAHSQGGPVDGAALDPALGRIYRYRPGCEASNAYCDTTWLGPAREGFTEPIRLWFCSARAATPLPMSMWILVLSCCALYLRRQRR